MAKRPSPTETIDRDRPSGAIKPAIAVENKDAATGQGAGRKGKSREGLFTPGYLGVFVLLGVIAALQALILLGMQYLKAIVERPLPFSTSYQKERVAAGGRRGQQCESATAQGKGWTASAQRQANVTGERRPGLSQGIFPEGCKWRTFNYEGVKKVKDTVLLEI